MVARTLRKNRIVGLVVLFCVGYYVKTSWNSASSRARTVKIPDMMGQLYYEDEDIAVYHYPPHHNIRLTQDDEGSKPGIQPPPPPRSEVQIKPPPPPRKIEKREEVLSPEKAVDGMKVYSCVNGQQYQAVQQYDDDFCDCDDGSDEPNTNACPDHDKKFSCKNGKGSTYHSMVGDGICDCCDGSDEPQGKCKDRCVEMEENERRRGREVEARQAAEEEQRRKNQEKYQDKE
eukprot:comp6118_c0_seq1/m.1953 comp6118_c0_seq1/g.1953  ORF comp6118_c0_seq1/g.1953 comp6118_c0_seq1/m.1953 type:complete len:231 (-) comp6118_c0_seq1:100-792(-)